MIISVAEVIETIIESGRRLIKVRRKGKSDVQTPFQVTSFGEDTNPPAGLRAIYGCTEGTGEPVVIGYLSEQVLEDLGVGEKRMFSTDEDGNLSTFIKLNSDGTMHLASDNDFAVRFSGFQDAFNELKQSVNDLTQAFNTHTHATAALGTPSPPTPGPGIPATPNATDPTPARIDEIKTP
jgi:hypothetical protein